MSLAKHIAKQLRDVYFGGNWTSVNLKDTLNDVGWKDATIRVQDLNSIAALVFHINYYAAVVSKVLQGGPLDGHDKFSFDLPPIFSEDDWQALLTGLFDRAMEFAALIEQIKDEKFFQPFADPKYGDYYRNLAGIIEHTHYHLGQIVLIKKMIRKQMEG